ncbi:hypothetical protein NL676_000751 [Syzygium grande]|nr:hypothetical protein NL676_000751 [Syzygium grande]
MVLHLLLAPYLTKLSSPTANGRVHSSVSRQVFDNQGGRRSANHQPTVWTYNYLQSLVADEGGQSRPADKLQREKAQMVEEEVRGVLHDENAEPVTIFALVDDIQRLGLGQQFEEDILRALHRCLSPDVVDKSLQKSLHDTALSLRILRQKGFHVSQDVFKIFTDESGNILNTLGNDVQGMLSLYEACNLAIEEEDILHEAKTFAMGHLKNLDRDINKDLQGEVNHELELSMQRRTPLWWINVGLANKLNFARDRLMECFFAAVAVADEPPLSNCRKGLTKVNTLTVILDDVYDIYGTLDELELFTDAVRRWDINAVEDLPGYMKLCFLALYNSVNEMAYDTLKETGENAIPYLTKAWYDLCKAFLQDAKWSYNKITPRVEEYLNNGWKSSSGQVMLTHAYFLSSPSMRKEELESLEHYHDLLRLPSMIFRLTNDLATSSNYDPNRAELERGEMMNSIRCYMQEMGLSKLEARKYVIKLIDTVWMKMNKYLIDDSTFNQSFVRMAFNLARIAHCVYHDGDAIGPPDNQSRSRVHSLIIDPISL